MPCKELVVCRPAWKSMTLCVCVLLFNVFSVNASYDFTIRFYEFRNPLGLQCDECGSDGGLPACCDDVQRTENCVNVAPFTCDTRFRFLLRPFGSSVETAPNTGFPYFTQSNTGNSDTFNEGPSGLLTLANPFNITSTEVWTGRIQFFIDAVDRPVAMSTSGLSETLAIINRFPIDLELDPGTNFTERTTYTGIYNISGLGFDMSFRVQCAESFFGPNCTTFCEPMEGVFTCDREGSVVCLNDNRDPSTNCSTCLQGWDLTTNCSTCSLYYDEQSQCTQCVTGRDISTNCTTCLPGYDPSTNCTQCNSGYDLSINCSQCLPGYDQSTSCTECIDGFNIATNCTECLPGTQCSTYQETTPDTSSSEATTSSPPPPVGSNLNLAVVGGAVGGAAALLILFLLVLCIVIVVMAIQLKRHRKSVTFPGATSGVDNPAFSRDLSVKERVETIRLGEHDFENPLYDEAKQEQQVQGDDSDYSKLQRPEMQKSFSPPKFPYTIDRSEETTYQLDVAGKSGTMEGHPGYDIAYPPSYNENGGAYDVTHHLNNNPYDVTHHASFNPQPSPSAIAGGIYNLANYQEEQFVYDVANHPTPVASGLDAFAQNDYADIPDPEQQHDYADIPEREAPHTVAPQYDYADTAQVKMTPPPPPPPPGHMIDLADHDYAETETPHPPDSFRPSMSPVAYANTTPGDITPEAMNHYEFGQ